MGGDLAAFRTPGRAQHRGHEPAGAVEDDDGLEAVVVVMGVEQPQLLAAVRRIEGVADVERDPLRHLCEGGAIEPDHGSTHFSSIRRSGRFSIRLTVDCEQRSRAPGKPLQRHLEHRVGAERIGVDAVLVAGRDHQHPKAQDVGDAVLGAGWIAGIVDAGAEPPGHIEPPLHLPQRQKTGVRRQCAAVEAGHHRLAVHG